MKKIALLLYTVIVLVLAASCDRRAEYLTASGAMLGTTFQATGDITDCTAQELYRAIMQIDAEAKASMSIFDSTSLLSRINRGETDSLDEHIIYNLRLAERFSRLSEGHYDVTVKPLVDAWGFAGHEAERTPNLDSLLQFVRLPARPYPGRQAREGRSPRTARFQLDRQGLYGRSGRGPHGALRREELSGGDRRRMPLPGCQQQRHSLADRA